MSNANRGTGTLGQNRSGDMIYTLLFELHTSTRTELAKGGLLRHQMHLDGFRLMSSDGPVVSQCGGSLQVVRSALVSQMELLTDPDQLAIELDKIRRA